MNGKEMISSASLMIAEMNSQEVNSERIENDPPAIRKTVSRRYCRDGGNCVWDSSTPAHTDKSSHPGQAYCHAAHTDKSSHPG
jgi:hypothetical protein